MGSGECQHFCARGSASVSVFHFAGACHLPCVPLPVGDWGTPGWELG